MVGLTVAALLKQSPQSERINIHVADAGSRPAYDAADIGLRVSALSPGSADVLRAAASWDHIATARACPFESMRVWDAAGSAGGPDALHFHADEFAVPALGYIVENALVQVALMNTLEALGQTIAHNSPVADITNDSGRYVLNFQDGQAIAADLLIGADGGNSFVRTSVGVAVDEWTYSQMAFVTHLLPEKRHGNTAWQRFLRAGPIALLPLDDGRVSTVWSTSKDQVDSARQASDAALSRMLGTATDGVLGALTPVGARGAFPLRAQHAKQYVLPGLVLLGDAAHSVHPLAGQGVNLGLADAACLAKTIAAAIDADEHPGDLPVLRRYERARRGANATMLHFIHGINRLFAAPSAPVSMLRTSGMWLFNQSGPLRRHTVRVALGIPA
jgi:2-octaprenylphenol hydroxylase